MSDRVMDEKNLFQTLAELLELDIDPNVHRDEIWLRYGRECAVMVLDSSGFTRVSERRGIIYYLARLVLMRKLVAPVLEENGSREFHFQADNIFATFDSPDAAIRAAEAAHRAVRDNGLMLTDVEPFRICIGIGFGRLLYSETLEGYFGEEMNFASKLGEDIAEGGETLLTERTWNAASEDVRKGYEHLHVLVSGMDLPYYRHRSIT